MVSARSSVWLLLLVLVGAGILRGFSVSWNIVPHSDIEMDASAAASFARDGRLLKSDTATTMEVPADLYLAQHPPVMPILAGALTVARGAPAQYDNAYFSLRLVSMASGLLLILLGFLVGSRLLGHSAGLMIALWMALSYLLIDFSGNGALYSLQAAFYLLWVLATFLEHPRMKACAMGLAVALAYLTNFQSIVLLPASVCLLLLQGKTWKMRCEQIALFFLVAAVGASPWLIRNQIIFGDAFRSHHVNNGYVLMKAGLGGDHVVTIFDWIDIVIGMLRVWIPNNLFYVARKLFILAPIAFVFFSFAWIDYLFSWKRFTKMSPILLLFVCHLLISVAWPITKFRFFVPMLPLVFLIAMEQLLSLPVKREQKLAWVGAITCSIAILSALTWNSIATHTYYFDGALTTDPFSGFQERDFMRTKGLLPSF
ncbi:hypothetical protein EXS70_00165 [Candidatus Peribacteria bacterium]|nr:hypothetical protein [Candidatus Peribacteria bacterium]